MKLAVVIVIVVALSACLLFLFAQPSLALPKSLSPSHCGKIAIDACVGTGKQANQAIHDNTNGAILFSGIFTNTIVNVSGLITIEITLNPDDTIEGNVNFSQFAGGQMTCGSGDFEGTKTGDEIELHFTSDSVDPACGFYQGVTFTIQAAYLNNTIIRGDYSTDTGSQGIVELRRILSSGVYMPYVRS